GQPGFCGRAAASRKPRCRAAAPAAPPHLGLGALDSRTAGPGRAPLPRRLPRPGAGKNRSPAARPRQWPRARSVPAHCSVAHGPDYRGRAASAGGPVCGPPLHRIFAPRRPARRAARRPPGTHAARGQAAPAHRVGGGRRGGAGAAARPKRQAGPPGEEVALVPFFAVYAQALSPFAML
nr:hypothetical protein [Tanacetum cinerariifolium]